MRKYWSFKKSRVKNNFDERENARRKWNGEKARAFLLQTEKYVRRNSSNSKNSKGQMTDAESSSEQEHKVNALASGADEGRDKLR